MTETVNYRQWAHRFAEIGAALTEKRNLEDLLSTILTEVRGLTSSDAGSIYRVVEVNGESYLHFEQAQNDSVDLPAQDFQLPMNRSSLAGYVTCEGDVLNIDDVYDLSEDRPFSFDPSFDERFDYRTRSMLVVPLKDRDARIRGVLQLMNRKRDFDRPFSDTEILTYPDDLSEMVRAFSSQAAVAMERAELDESIQSMIDSMIQTLVNALDQRDEITTGHSRRLAGYAVHLARLVNESDRERWRDVEITESEQELLYYSALLHDIGKIAVPEAVLSKRNRLSEDRMDAIRFRLDFLEEVGWIEGATEVFEELESINRSGYLQEEQARLLDDLRGRDPYTNGDRSIPVLTDEEYHHLSIQKGNLTEGEREQIQYHAKATHDILKRVEWTRTLERVPEVACLHHEKLDGTGYPWGVDGEEIPLLARILAVVDIFEALTAQDRPYRDAMSPEQARDVLEEEAEENHLDPDLVRLFFEEDAHREAMESPEEYEVVFGKDDAGEETAPTRVS